MEIQMGVRTHEYHPLIGRILTDSRSNPLLESTLAEVERSGAMSPISMKACGRGWLSQISNISRKQDGMWGRNDMLTEMRFTTVICFSGPRS